VIMDRNIILKLLTEHQAELISRYGVQRLGLFGSYTRGQQNKTSDIDILVSFSKEIDLFDFIDLREYLESRLQSKVDLVMETALEAGAEDVKQEDDQFEVLTDPQCFSDVCEALEAAGIETDAAEVTLLSDLMVPVSDVSVGKAVMRFVTALEDNDDVQDVYHNMDMDDSIIEAVAAELD
jgi:predicted nucleotidyltransferase